MSARPCRARRGHADRVKKLGRPRLSFKPAALTFGGLRVLRRRPREWSSGVTTGTSRPSARSRTRTKIAAIREAIAYAERAFSMLRNGLRLGETEKDVGRRLEGYLRRCGATAASFPPIVAVGVDAALPHARPTDDGPGRRRTTSC